MLLARSRDVVTIDIQLYFTFDPAELVISARVLSIYTCVASARPSRQVGFS